MPSESTAVPLHKMQWSVELVAKDEDGLAFYLTQYKAFRLLSLQVDASCKSPKNKQL